MGSGRSQALESTEKELAQQEQAPKSRGHSKTLETDQRGGPERGGRVWSIPGADSDHGMRDGHEQVPEREAFLFVAGTGAEARDLGRESAEEQDIEDEEPCRPSLPDGSTIGEASRLCLRSGVPAIESQIGTGAGDGCDSACHRQGGVPDVEVQGGIRDAQRGRVRAKVQRPATQIHEEEGGQTGIPTDPGLSAGKMKTKGVLARRTSALHLIGSGIYVDFCAMELNLRRSVRQGRTLSP